MMLCRILLILVLFVVSIQQAMPAKASNADQLTIEAAELVDNGGYAVESDGQLLASHNLHTMYIPASIIKIATALSALEILGPDYQFETHFFVDAARNLYIKGFGDPYLVSEEVSLIMDRLQQLGVHTINNIYLDHSSYHLSYPTDGLGFSDNPYDALNSGLAVNFNTVKIQVSGKGEVQSAEEQTPTVPLMQRLGKDMKPGSYRINISTDEKNGYGVISRYVGELVRAFQQQKGIDGGGEITEKQVPENLAPVYVHRSGKSLLEIIEPLMLYSNNFIANQLFLACGAKQYGYPATWAKGRRALVEYMEKSLGLAEKDVKLVEGSGLSRRNRVSPYAMLLILHAFKPYGHLLPPEDNKRIKSGTLKGIYSYAGYFMNAGELDSFVLILNQSGNKRDTLLKLLERYYRRKGKRVQGF
jgi:D-alanyl-D-alanine carboxypeptidase/D-alanyl-D-alanine-endopeptidase (penicillin-binding protein 4)